MEHGDGMQKFLTVDAAMADNLVDEAHVIASIHCKEGGL